MVILQYILGAIILALAVVLIVFITMQQGKRKGLENVISGNSGGNSYLNKTEAAKKGKRFERWTLYLAILFAVLVIALFIISKIPEKKTNTNTTVSSVVSVDTSDTASDETTSASSDVTSAETTSSEAASSVATEETGPAAE